ncbi:protein kinase domain-containing protein [Microbacterium hydrothermale]|uniref:protein kinase domain-containing protein n=1 Tax=Microbacterium hydrothermale TaxID=857427 RepID=UPI00142D8560|nr:PASTA domain-containing protein [Microbacterium hydrothermale]
MTGVEDPAFGGGLIAGRFRLGELLGSGGTASVFAAVDTVTGRRLAVKLLHPHLSESAPVRDAFLAEARRTAQVAHPAVVVIVDIGVSDDSGTPIAWIAQERVAGRPLSEHVRAEGPLSPREAVAVAADVLAGLEAAHAAGVIHRDVSPSNVLVRRETDGGIRATLLDFGLADAAGRTAHGDDVLRSAVTDATAGVVGNVQYASPEQLSGRPVGPRGDLYQVGGLLMFALTGRAPFDGDDRLALARAHLSAPPPVPSVRRHGIAPALDRVVVRALLKDPEDRFADAGAMRAALLAAQATVDAPASGPRTPQPGRQRAEPSVARRPAAAGALPVVPSSTPAPSPSSPGRRSAGWGTVIAVVAVLVAAATAVPLLAGAGREIPVAEAATRAPSPPPTTPPTPDPTPIVASPSTPPPVTVPALTSYADAPTVLASAGLRVGEVTVRDEAAVAGTVLESIPGAGSSVPRDSAVALVVASGSNTVPEVSGMDAATATSHLRAAGFATTVVAVVSERAEGLVVALEPAAGSSVVLGSAVRVLVARAPAPSPTPTSPAVTPSPSPTVAPMPTPTILR